MFTPGAVWAVSRTVDRTAIPSTPTSAPSHRDAQVLRNRIIAPHTGEYCLPQSRRGAEERRKNMRSRRMNGFSLRLRVSAVKENLTHLRQLLEPQAQSELRPARPDQQTGYLSQVSACHAQIGGPV